LTKREEILGRAVVLDGRMVQLRNDLGLTKSAMAELLHTTPKNYAAWEDNPQVRLWSVTAERIGAFYTLAVAELEYITDELEMDPHELMPLYVASTALGIPQELMLKRYRDGQFEADDLGVLGLWIHTSVLDQLRR
jgi:DNA-binding XRE family transcriptional regulator